MMIHRLAVVLASAFCAATIAACSGEGASPTATPLEAPNTASRSTGTSANVGGSGGIQLACSVSIVYTFKQQDGTVVSTNPYAKAFVVTSSVPFVEDLSTSTRAKVFRASAVDGGRDAVVSMRYFNDVGVFHAIDIGSTLSLENNLATRTTTGDNTFSTSVPGLNGHHETTYTLTCGRA